jgi:RNA polymerase sigma-70 factor (ECF subfamily)
MFTSSSISANIKDLWEAGVKQTGEGRRHMTERSNDQWLKELSAPAPGCNKAIQELRSFLFRGDSKFTTWATKIAVNTCISGLRRRHWEDVSLDDLEIPEVYIDATRILQSTSDPELLVLRKSIIETVNKLIAQELTPRQKTAITAVQKYGMPLGEVAGRLGTNQNALYKLLHDARKRLKDAMTARGINQEDVMELFS